MAVQRQTGLAYIATQAGDRATALAECAWLVRSQWVFNTAVCSAMTLATVVHAWLL